MNDEARARALQAKLAAGVKVESESEMTDEYRRILIRMMTRQADSELAGAYGYLPWIEKAPTVDEKLVMSIIVKDEVRHAKAIYALLRELGEDVEALIAQGMKHRLSVFWYPIETWTDVVCFNFLVDRAAGHQLQDAKASSYGPWSRAMASIEKEEVMHVHHGELWVQRLARNPATLEEVQTAIDTWFARTDAVFGREGPQKTRLLRLGLKRQTNEAVRAGWRAEVAKRLAQYGLRVPAAAAAEEAAPVDVMPALVP